MQCSDLKIKRSEVVADLKDLQLETDPIIKIFEDEAVGQMMEGARWVCLSLRTVGMIKTSLYFVVF